MVLLPNEQGKQIHYQQRYLHYSLRDGNFGASLHEFQLR